MLRHDFRQDERRAPRRYAEGFERQMFDFAVWRQCRAVAQFRKRCRLQELPRVANQVFAADTSGSVDYFDWPCRYEHQGSGSLRNIRDFARSGAAVARGGNAKRLRVLGYVRGDGRIEHDARLGVPRPAVCREGFCAFHPDRRKRNGKNVL